MRDTLEALDTRGSRLRLRRIELAGPERNRTSLNYRVSSIMHNRNGEGRQILSFGSAGRAGGLFPAVVQPKLCAVRAVEPPLGVVTDPASRTSVFSENMGLKLENP